MLPLAGALERLLALRGHVLVQLRLDLLAKRLHDDELAAGRGLHGALGRDIGMALFDQRDIDTPRTGRVLEADQLLAPALGDSAGHALGEAALDGRDRALVRFDRLLARDDLDHVLAELRFRRERQLGACFGVQQPCVGDVERGRREVDDQGERLLAPGSFSRGILRRGAELVRMRARAGST